MHNQAFNVGRTEDNYQIRDLADIVKDTVPNTTIEYASDGGTGQALLPRGLLQDTAQVLPAFQPQWDARKGARRTATKPSARRI